MIFYKKHYKTGKQSYIIRWYQVLSDSQEETDMKLWKTFVLASLCAVALSGCTTSSLSQGTQSENVNAGELADEDETVEKAPLIEEETEEQPMYDWEQVKDETDSLFSSTSQYPQSESMTFEADEDALTIKLTWIVKDDTTEEQAMEYAAEMVKQFNDIVAVQSEDLQSSTADSFGNLWDTFALTVQVGTKDGTWLVDKSYEAGEAIDLTLSQDEGEGPEPEEYNGPVKDETKK